MTAPAPLVPSEVDLTDFAYMPLDVRRLRDSDLSALESPEACWAAVLLWSASWHQVPASSVPDDDRVLAQLAGYGRVVKEWLRVREGAMRGFVLCTDGRYYHPVVAEKAVEAWQSKLEHAHRKLCDRLRKENKARAEAGEPALPIPSFEHWNSTRVPSETPSLSGGKGRLSAGNPPEKPLKGEVRERERERDRDRDSDATASGVAKPPPAVPLPTTPAGAAGPGKPAPRRRSGEPPPTAATWAAYSEAYLRRYATTPVRNATVNGQLASLVAKLGAEEAPLVAAFYVGHSSAAYVRCMHDPALLVRDASGLRTQWASGRTVTARDASEADRLAADGAMWGRVAAGLRENVDG